MKIFLTALIAVAAATTAAAPALAHPHDGEHARYEQDGPWRPADERQLYGVDRRQEALERRIAWGVRRGDLSHREADRLRDEHRQIAWLEARFRGDGYLSRGERAALDARLDRLEARLRFERHDREYGYGYGERSDRRW
jgi:hypothetical protein